MPKPRCHKNMNKQKAAFSILFLLSVIFMTGCDIINPAEPIPSYIKTDSFPFQPSVTMGSSSNKIQDVYVYVDTKFQGAYPLGSTIPIIESGTHQLELFPGIAINGIGNTRVPYPFYSSFTQNYDLKPGEIISINPPTGYTASDTLSWLEDFENAGLSFIQLEPSDTGIVALADGDANNFEGKSGAVYLDSAHPKFQIVTAEGFTLPRSGSPVYLEMNYKCNNSFVVGMVATTSISTTTFSVLNVNAKDEWNKIYVELAPSISTFNSAINFKIFLGATQNAGVTYPVFYFDNLKLVHLK